MNIKNIEAAINVMKKAQNLDMANWQKISTANGGKRGRVNTVEELHSCGNTACFAGYVALLDEFKEDGGSVNWNGAPQYGTELDPKNHVEGVGAIARFLEIDEDLADSLVHSNDHRFRQMIGVSEYSTFYEKFWEDVTPEDVIQKLEMIKSGELV